MKRLLYCITSVFLLTSLIGCAGTFNSSKTKDKDKQIVSSSKQPQEKQFDELTDFKIKETDNFQIFYVETDSECADQIGALLEKNCQRIVQDLKPEEDGKTQVRIYPDLKEFHKAIGNENAEDWVVGVCFSKYKLLMVSPNNPGPAHNYDSVLSVAIHEFTHCVTQRMGTSIRPPKWVGEGVAVYEANQVGTPDLNNLPSISRLNEAENNEIYNYGYDIFEFIAKQYGKESIRTLILNNGDIQKTFKCSVEQFESKWKEYLKSRGKR